ncbi:leucine-rich repeat protein, partial [Candidatus Poribacteria bacterium]|nr:leucine-rich repeat protein [Candidatus Poribacteria bacterium]
ATDVDANTTLAYTLGGTDASSFSIVGTTGQLQTSAALDYETKNSYSVTVSVSDSNSGRDSITVTIRVTATPFLPVNQRTPGVQREIVNVIRNINSADDVTKEHLAEITGLYFSNITSLKSGDFDGLTNLTTLSLSQNKLASLPSDVFDGLTNLTTLYLSDNPFTSLPSGVFDGLTALTTLYLDNNKFTSLPSGVFDGLTALTVLWLHNNPFTSLPSGVFDELTALITLNLAYNAISNVSALENMTALTHLYLSGNPISDYGPLSRLKAAIDAIEDHPGIFIDIDINNNIPVFTDGTSTARSIAENTASGTNIGDPVSATDADTDDPLAYTLGGTDAESFSIVSTSGQLQTNAALDYETQSAYTVTVDVAAGFYHSRSRAIHWDGRNRVGEKVASGLYFYTFTAGDFTATRKLLIRK